MDARTARTPFPGHHLRWLVVGLFLALAFRLVLAYLSSGFPFDYRMAWPSDTKYVYKPLAENLVLGRGFSLDRIPPYHPSIFRAPIYPFFLAGIYRVTSFSDNAVVFAQVLLSTVSCLVFYGLARELFADHPARDAIALVAFFFLAFNPFTNAFNSYILTETLSQCLLLFALYLMVRAINSGGVTQAIFSGVFCALSFLTHPVTAIAVFLLGVWLLVLALKDRAVLRPFLGFTLGVIILWTPWVVRNYVHFNRFVPLNVGGGFSLYLAVSPLEENKERIRECQDLDIIHSQSGTYVLVPDGLEGLENDARCYRMAWRIVRNHPWGFVRHALKKPVRMWISSYSSYLFPQSDKFGTRLIFWDKALVERVAKDYKVSWPYVWFLVVAKLLLRLLNPFFIMAYRAGAGRADNHGHVAER
jgi:4-amino-4-deoxy-L-arabinose transferase-like glycosyltransferase